MSTAGIIFSSLNNDTLTRLTSDRTVAAIPFACRYRIVDFGLSNMVNANISNISIVANYNYRSLVEHVGSGKDWDLARRAGGINFISPYQSSHSSSAKLYSTRLEALRNMQEHIAEFKEDNVVLMRCDAILNFDLQDVIRQHDKSGAAITFVTKRITPDFSAKIKRLMFSTVAGKITDIAMSNTYLSKNPELSLDILVMKTEYLRALIREAEGYNYKSLTEMLFRSLRSRDYRTYLYDGYVASISSFLDYYRASMDMVNNCAARESLLNKQFAPIYTKVHNSAPVIYKAGSHVENSMIADECVIEGTVINSVLFRGVKVEKGAVVKNSVLFYGTHVGSGARVNCVVADKNVYIGDGTAVLSGNENIPFYIQKGRRI